jgi:hypothetical protein
MSTDHLSVALADVISTLDMVAGWLGDASGGDIQACAEVALAAEKLHTLKLEIEREQFAGAPA